MKAVLMVSLWAGGPSLDCRLVAGASLADPEGHS
jgi:hypothetical protein